MERKQNRFLGMQKEEEAQKNSCDLDSGRYKFDENRIWRIKLSCKELSYCPFSFLTRDSPKYKSLLFVKEKRVVQLDKVPLASET